MRASRYRVAGAVMLAVGALLLTASGGYYAYAQFAKTSRGDLVHETARPTFLDSTLSTYTGTETTYTGTESRLDNSTLGVNRAIEVASLVSNPEHRVTEEPSIASEAATRTETVDSNAIVAQTEKLPSSVQPGMVQTPIEALREFQAFTAKEAREEAMPKNGRIGAAIEELVLLQARRPGAYVDFEPEEPVVGELIDIEPPEEKTIRGHIVLPNSNRNPTTNEEMTAALLESNIKRPTSTIPKPEFATRMIIPEIGLSATVEELEVVEEDDSRAWETPKHVVGHIPTTAKPGTSGQGWYFGHLQSPISGEGNVFRRLPELAAKFKRGEQFTIHLDAGNKRYVYQVYRTEVVHASKFAVSDSGLSDITLVACWPQFEYSERVLVTAGLVRIVPIPESEHSQASSG